MKALLCHNHYRIPGGEDQVFADERRLLRDSLLVSLADTGWVLGTILVVSTGILMPAGNIVAALIALGVADFGAAQFGFRSRAMDDGAEPRAAVV